jgi:small-conductance mechanosensitive channel
MDFSEIDFRAIVNYVFFETDRFQLSVSTLLMIAVIIVIVWLVLKLIRYILMRYAKRKKLELGSAHSVYLIIKYFLTVIAFVLILETLGIKISILIASAAALLVGIGFGIQQLFNDLASGIVLLIEHNVKIHDIVEIESGQDVTVGVVIKTGLRTSKVRTRDNIIIDIPNSMLVNNKVINWSQIEKSTRFHVNVGVAYGSDIHLVKKVLLTCAKDKKEIINNPPPFVRFIDFGNSSLDFQLYFWTSNSFGVEHIKSDLRFEIHDALSQNGIRIPFPQRDVHIIPQETPKKV